MKINFNKSLSLVLKHEGGFVDHPADPGGATLKGVTQAVYNAYRNRHNSPAQSVKLMSDTEMKEIYKFQYWDAINGDCLPSGIDYCVFDGAVNSGPSQSVKWLQRQLDIKADGKIGNITLDKVKETDDKTLIKGICEQRRAFLRSLKTFSVFGKGWMRRVKEVEANALAMAEKKKVTQPKADAAPEKALPEDKKVSSTLAGKGTIIASAGTAGASINEAAEKLSPFTEYSTIIQYVFLALIVVGLGLTVYSVVKKTKEGAYA